MFIPAVLVLAVVGMVVVVGVLTTGGEERDEYARDACLAAQDWAWSMAEDDLRASIVTMVEMKEVARDGFVESEDRRVRARLSQLADDLDRNDAGLIEQLHDFVQWCADGGFWPASLLPSRYQ